MRKLEQFEKIIDTDGDDQQTAGGIGDRLEKSYFLDKKEIQDHQHQIDPGDMENDFLHLFILYDLS